MIYDSTATVPIKNEICSQKKKKASLWETAKL